MTLGAMAIKNSCHPTKTPHAQSHHQAPPDLHQPKHHPQQVHAQCRARTQAFDHVRQPGFGRDFVEPKTLLYAKGLHQRQGQADQAAHQTEPQYQRDLLRHARAHPVQQNLVQGIQSSEQCPAQQHCGIQCNVYLRQAGLGEGVISRLLVVCQRYRIGLGGRHSTSVQ